MKKNLLLFVAYCFLVGSAIAQTNVSGFISANTTWDLAGSPYIVVGNALVSHGYTLTIDPGVVVKFNTDKALQIDGELIAIGTPQNRITFTSNQISPVAGDWAKIHFSDTCADAVFDGNGNYLSGCIMKYCDVLYGGSLGVGEIHIESSSPYFSSCRILNSLNDGVYSQGATYLMDSSAVKNCSGIGLSFYDVLPNSCGLTIKNDSLIDNLSGGIYFGNGTALFGCSTIINKNYFSGNLYNGAIYLSNTGQGVKITENYFLNNSSSSSSTLNISGIDVKISDNYFQNNSGNSIVSSYAGSDTVECNSFISNQTGSFGKGVVFASAYAGSIRSNLFDSNVGYTVAASYIQVGTSTCTISFSNNTIRNNSSPSGSCCVISVDLSSIGPRLIDVHDNDFAGNHAANIIYVERYGTSTGTNGFLRLKSNNLNNPGSQYELYNNLPYGAPDLHIDSNYWGSTSTQHIDSVIYDYFDDANKSVVYYTPILSSPVLIDTTCTFTTTAMIPIEKATFTSSLFPNPFSQQAVIRFANELHEATFNLYNVFSQLVQSKNNISGREIIIDRENLDSGIYLYEVIEQQKRICSGKAIVY